MTQQHDDAEGERRQQERLAILSAIPDTPYTSRLAQEQRDGRTGDLPPRPPRTAPRRPRTEREERLDAGFIFSDLADRQAEAKAEHAARRRRADQARQGNERLYNALRDDMGEDYADEWMNGGDAA